MVVIHQFNDSKFNSPIMRIAAITFHSDGDDRILRTQESKINAMIKFHSEDKYHGRLSRPILEVLYEDRGYMYLRVQHATYEIIYDKQNEFVYN